MPQARCCLELVAGMVPGTPMPEFTRRWFITSEEWEVMRQREDMTPEHPDNLLTRYSKEAHEELDRLIALCCTGHAPNWVRLDWIWF